MYCMTLGWQSVLAVLVLSVAAILVPILNNHEFSFSHPLIIFSVFNTIIVVSMVESHKSPVHETERDIPVFSYLYEVEGASNSIIKENHKEEEEVMSVLAVLVLGIAAILVLILNNYEFSFSHPITIFSVFNSIIVASIVGSHKSPVHETKKDMSFFSYWHEVEDAYDQIIKENHKEEEEEEEEEEEGDVCASDVYEEDDDDNGSDDDGDEYDENLDRKIEDFIAKINKRWREEKLMETAGRLEKIGYEA